MSSVFTSKSRPGQCCEHQTDMHYVLARALMSEATVNQKSDTLKLNRLLSKSKVALPVISLRWLLLYGPSLFYVLLLSMIHIIIKLHHRFMSSSYGELLHHRVASISYGELLVAASFVVNELPLRHSAALWSTPMAVRSGCGSSSLLEIEISRTAMVNLHLFVHLVIQVFGYFYFWVQTFRFAEMTVFRPKLSDVHFHPFYMQLNTLMQDIHLIWKLNDQN